MDATGEYSFENPGDISLKISSTILRIGRSGWSLACLIHQKEES
jgi:hypothetical protein